MTFNIGLLLFLPTAQYRFANGLYDHSVSPPLSHFPTTVDFPRSQGVTNQLNDCLTDGLSSLHVCMYSYPEIMWRAAGNLGVSLAARSWG